jgi:Ca2+-binding RTX toxin-like protein
VTINVSYVRGNGGISLTQVQLDQLRNLRDTQDLEYQENNAALGLGTPMYELLLGFISDVHTETVVRHDEFGVPYEVVVTVQVPKAGVDLAVWKWIEGAAKVNSGVGFFADFIREYTKVQYQMRGGTGSAEFLNQKASNNIAFNLINDILAPANGGSLPGISGLGAIDAGAAASTVFAGLPGASGGDYAPWAGTLLFPYLGFDNFFSDLLLNHEQVIATIEGDGTKIIKNTKGTYDLVAAISAAQKAAQIAGIANFLEAMQNLLGPNVPDTNQENLVSAANQFFWSFYGLTSADGFEPGDDLVFRNIDSMFGENYIVGTYDNDSGISGNLMADIINAGKGDDVVLGSAGGDLIDGGEGVDTVDYSSFSNELELKINTDLSGGADFDYRFELEGLISKDLLFDIERIKLGSDNDTLKLEKIEDGALEGIEWIDMSGGSSKTGDTIDLTGMDEAVSVTKEDENSVNVARRSGGSFSLEVRGAETINGSDFDDYIEGGSGENYLHGGDGNDDLYSDSANSRTDSGKNYLLGNDGDDKLYGANGMDLLDGGEGDDHMEGGNGRDLYNADNGDTIMDEDGSGAVFLERRQLVGGTRKEEDPENEYRNGNTLYVFNEATLTLTVNGGLTIEQFSNGDLGIFLETEPDDEEKPDMGDAETRASPLVIDLDGDGVESVAYSRDRYFDHDANGMLESTAWAGGDDGLLVRDLNGNGRIDSGRELFGSSTRLANGALAGNGFLALSDLDANQDGVVNSQDAAFSELRIWRDGNGNGLTESGELLTLEQAGLTGVRTQWATSNIVDGNGQAHRQIGSGIRSDGSNASISDIWFTSDASRRINGVEVSPEVLFDLIDLPDAKAFGNLMDLHQAMALDTTLRGLVETYVDQLDSPQRNAMLRDIIFQWAGVTQIAPHSRGGSVDARELAVVELMSGRPYTNNFTPNDPNPRFEAGNLLTSEFNEFLQYVGAQIEAQTRYADTGIFLAGFASGYNHVIVDFEAFKQYIIDAHDQSDFASIVDLSVLTSTLASYSPTLRTETNAALAELLLARPEIESYINVVSSVTGTVGSDMLFGSTGKDLLSGGQGNDKLYGQDGDDIYVYRSGEGNDQIFDSKGTDQIYFMGGILPSHVSLRRDVSSIIITINVNGVVGEVRINNVFEGTEGALREGVIELFRFDNGTTWNLSQILAGITQQATEGNDGLYGTATNETFFGLSGNDEIAGYGGNDVIDGGAGDDTLTGGSGNDVLIGGTNNDSMEGGNGSDTYVFNLGDGQDTINNHDASSGRVDVLQFGNGIAPADVTARRSGNHLVLTIVGTGGQVTVSNYFINDGVGSYRLDEIRFSNEGETVWNVATVQALVLAPTSGNDILQGYVSNDTLFGDGGNDTLYGNAGDDVLQGGAGDDVLDGGTGSDIYLFNTGDGQDTINNYDGSAGRIDVLQLGGDIDPADVTVRRVGNDLVLTFSGSNDHVTVTGYFNGDTASGNSLNEIRFSDLAGTAWNVTTIKAKVLESTSGNDVLQGYATDDQIEGEGGNDAISGNAGNDVLIGGHGDDNLNGGAGSDVYVFNAGDGQDTISNYDNGIATIDALQFGAGISPTDVTARRAGNSLVLTLNGSSDQVVVSEYFIADAGGGYQLEEIRFADSPGIIWGVETVRSLVMLPTDGNDILQGYATDDSISGGSGNDILYGHAGNDGLGGQDGSDTLYGGEGDDTMAGSSGSDTLHGDAGNDVLDGGTDNDILRGGLGTDHLTGGLGNDQLEGGDGDDHYNFAVGNGQDTISDTQGLSTLHLSGLPLEQVYLRRDGTTLVLRFTGSSTDQIRLVNFFDVSTQLALRGLVIDTGNGTPWPLTATAVDAAVLVGTSLDDVIDGNTLNNMIAGLAGDDTLRGGAGADSLDGGAGNDALYGQDGNDVLVGGDGNDLLDGGAGADQLTGGAGDDTYVVDHAGDLVVEANGAGVDTVLSSVSFALPDSVEHLTLTGSSDINGTGNVLENTLTGNSGNNHLQGLEGNDILTGNDGDDVLEGGIGNDQLDGGYGIDVLQGGAGNDVLDGSGGIDQLIGGAGDDTYLTDESGDVIVEQANEGTDVVLSTAYSYELSANIEQLTLVEASGAYTGIGNALDNLLTGNSNDNYLDGGTGADTIIGGLGNDIYVVDNAGDQVVELVDEGEDTVESSVNYTLGSTLENLTLLGDANLDGTGNDQANVLRGNTGNNRLDGGAGGDDLHGGEGDDYFVNDSSGDWIYEYQGEGLDTIERRYETNLVLSNNVENLILATGVTTGHGNNLDNVITGNAGANSSLGLAGTDQIYGLDGNDSMWGGVDADQLFGGNGDDYMEGDEDDDYLEGGAGHDQMEGGAGIDTLIGGTGDDKYIAGADTGTDLVDNTGGGFDSIFFREGVTAAQLVFTRDGDDLLIAVTGQTTPAIRVQNHFLGGDAAIDYVQPDGGFYLTTAQINQIVAGGGTGGEFDQVIEGTASGEQLVGSSGKDLIKGLAGDDSLFGLGGNDTLQGGDGADYLAGGNGSGTGSGADRLEGGAGNDTLTGEDGANVLIGGLGNDSYVYGGGLDSIDNTGGGNDGVFFNNGITAANLAFTRIGDDLIITANGNASATVTVTNHFLGGDYAIDFVQPSSGNLLNTAAINALVGGGTPGGGGNPGNDADYSNVVTGTASGEQLLGTSGRDLIRGLAGNDTLFGFGGDDKFEGGDGDDYLSGGNGSYSGSGNDILIGGAGVDTLVGEDGNDIMLGGTGNDKYVYGGGSDTIDNVGGGTDWVFFNSSSYKVDRTRLTFHQDGNDLLIRVDGDASKQIRVQKHFLGGENAISYVQPDGGNAISASSIAGQLTPLQSGAQSSRAMGGNLTPSSESVYLASGWERHSRPGDELTLPTEEGVPERQVAILAIPETAEDASPSVHDARTTGGNYGVITHKPMIAVTNPADVLTRWKPMYWGEETTSDWRRFERADQHRSRYAAEIFENQRQNSVHTRGNTELDTLIAMMAGFPTESADASYTMLSSHVQRHDFLTMPMA